MVLMRDLVCGHEVVLCSDLSQKPGPAGLSVLAVELELCECCGHLLDSQNDGFFKCLDLRIPLPVLSSRLTSLWIRRLVGCSMVRRSHTRRYLVWFSGPLGWSMLQKQAGKRP